MKNVFLFHGYIGKKMSDWLLWLEKELKKNKVDVYFPEYNNSQKPVMADWLKEFEITSSEINFDTIFIAHSLGCLVALLLLQQSNIKISKVILTACLKNEVSSQNLKGLWAKISEEEKESIASFIEQELDWQKIKDSADDFVFYFSKDDYAVDFEENFEFYKKLFPDAKFKIYDNHGHFNHKNDIYEMPDILSEII